MTDRTARPYARRLGGTPSARAYAYTRDTERAAHYYAPATRRFFAVRVLECATVSDGAGLLVLESRRDNARPGAARRYRVVYFAPNGTHYAGPDFATPRAARLAYRATLAA